jgi:acetyltransferase-like isoleucine patch superfamily enzyme
MVSPSFTKDCLRNLIIEGTAEVGDYTYGNPRILKWGENVKLKIGKFCSIADEVVIFLGGNHRIDWMTTYPFPAFKDAWPEGKDIQGHPCTKGDVIIDNDVWIGFGATILSGVKIGDGAVISAKSLVTKNVKPYTVVGGNPAETLFYRFNKKTIDILLKLKWWDLPYEIISTNIHILCANNLEKLEQFYEEAKINRAKFVV